MEKFYVSGVDKPYHDFGPAFSRAQNEALKRQHDDEIYVTLDGEAVAIVTRRVEGPYLIESRQLR